MEDLFRRRTVPARHATVHLHLPGHGRTRAATRRFLLQCRLLPLSLPGCHRQVIEPEIPTPWERLNTTYQGPRFSEPGDGGVLLGWDHRGNEWDRRCSFERLRDDPPGVCGGSVSRSPAGRDHGGSEGFRERHPRRRPDRGGIRSKAEDHEPAKGSGEYQKGISCIAGYLYRSCQCGGRMFQQAAEPVKSCCFRRAYQQRGWCYRSDHALAGAKIYIVHPSHFRKSSDHGIIDTQRY